MLQKEKNGNFRFTNKTQAAIDAMRIKARFAKARHAIQGLEQTNSPLYWDILWDALETGELIEPYIDRYAREWFFDITDVEVRNTLHRRFRMLHDSTQRIKFPQEFVKRNEDGSFYEIDEEAIDAQALEKNTVTVPKEVMNAIEQVKTGLETLGIHPNYVGTYFPKCKSEIMPKYDSIIKVVGK